MTRTSWLVWALLAMPAGTTAAATATLEERDFTLRKGGEDRVVFQVAEPGTIQVRIEVREPLTSSPVALLLEGPNGIQVDKKGAAPLRLRFTVTDAAQVGDWRAIVSNPGKLARLVGRIAVRFEASAPQATAPPTAAPPTAAPQATARAAPPVTDGRIRAPEDRSKIRAVCRDKNEDVFVRVDLESGEGAFFLRYRPVFRLRATARETGLVELRGDGEAPLRLDLGQKALFVEGKDGGLFCRVRLYYGDAGL